MCKHHIAKNIAKSLFGVRYFHLLPELFYLSVLFFLNIEDRQRLTGLGNNRHDSKKIFLKLISAGNWRGKQKITGLKSRLKQLLVQR